MVFTNTKAPLMCAMDRLKHGGQGSSVPLPYLGLKGFVKVLLPLGLKPYYSEGAVTRLGSV